MQLNTLKTSKSNQNASKIFEKIIDSRTLTIKLSSENIRILLNQHK